jgi:hypothetical protein
MKFDYLTQPNFSDPNAPWVSRPYIPICLRYQQDSANVYALVDSGADTCLFHSSVGQALGLDVTTGRLQKFFGISEEGIEVYFHTLKFQIIGSTDLFEIEAGFTPSDGVKAILGQKGFFERYKIIFERYKDRLEIIPNRK